MIEQLALGPCWCWKVPSFLGLQPIDFFNLQHFGAASYYKSVWPFSERSVLFVLVTVFLCFSAVLPIFFYSCWSVVMWCVGLLLYAMLVYCGLLLPFQLLYILYKACVAFRRRYLRFEYMHFDFSVYWLQCFSLGFFLVGVFIVYEDYSRWWPLFWFIWLVTFGSMFVFVLCCAMLCCALFLNSYAAFVCLFLSVWLLLAVWPVFVGFSSFVSVFGVCISELSYWPSERFSCSWEHYRYTGLGTFYPDWALTEVSWAFYVRDYTVSREFLERAAYILESSAYSCSISLDCSYGLLSEGFDFFLFVTGLSLESSLWPCLFLEDMFWFPLDSSPSFSIDFWELEILNDEILLDFEDRPWVFSSWLCLFGWVLESPWFWSGFTFVNGLLVIG